MLQPVTGRVPPTGVDAGAGGTGDELGLGLGDTLGVGDTLAVGDTLGVGLRLGVDETPEAATLLHPRCPLG